MNIATIIKANYISSFEDTLESIRLSIEFLWVLYYRNNVHIFTRQLNHNNTQELTMEKNNEKPNDNPSYDITSSSRPLSIEAATSSGRILPMENQPRQPANLAGILRFAMQATKTEDAPPSSHITPMDEEKKTFLNKALNSFAVNITKELEKAVEILRNVIEVRLEDDPTQYNDALELIAEYVDRIDVANDFYKIGGCSIFGPCLNSCHASIRWKAADSIAVLTQNNPFCQLKMLEMGFVPILLRMVDSDPSEHARVKSLYAVSCIVRSNGLGMKYMDVNEGYAVLMRALQSPVQKLQIKSAFLLSALCSEEKAHSLRSSLIKMGLIEQAAGLLSMSNIHPETRHGLINILNSLSINNNLPALRECRRPELCLKQTLERRLLDMKLENSADEIEACAQLLDRIFADHSMSQDR